MRVRRLHADREVLIGLGPIHQPPPGPASAARGKPKPAMVFGQICVFYTDEMKIAVFRQFRCRMYRPLERESPLGKQHESRSNQQDAIRRRVPFVIRSYCFTPVRGDSPMRKLGAFLYRTQPQADAMGLLAAVHTLGQTNRRRDIRRNRQTLLLHQLLDVRGGLRVRNRRLHARRGPGPGSNAEEPRSCPFMAPFTVSRLPLSWASRAAP